MLPKISLAITALFFCALSACKNSHETETGPNSKKDSIMRPNAGNTSETGNSQSPADTTKTTPPEKVKTSY